MGIYTRRGDLGETDLIGGPRVAKDMARIQVCGAVDELNSHIGLARAHGLPERADAILERVQHELFAVGAEIATPQPDHYGTRRITSDRVQALEDDIDRLTAEMPRLTGFILPGGAIPAAELHVARTVCRRAERELVALMRRCQSEHPIAREVLSYLNRLSDLLFTMARAVNAALASGDEPAIFDK